jgi:hypothetical protein
MTREAVGEFQHLVLLAILHLGDGVYAHGSGSAL